MLLLNIETQDFYGKAGRVSILVLMDVALKLVWVRGIQGNFLVSILVLMDVALKPRWVYDALVSRGIEFQSLF